MNENARKWVAALRSGEYEQGDGYLSRDGRFCCLGVACDLYQREIGALPIEDDLGYVRYDGHSSILPDSVRAWLGLNTSGGQFHQNDSLIERNDEGEDFEAIATLIEGEPGGLFLVSDQINQTRRGA